jgi:hypothetical protein
LPDNQFKLIVLKKLKEPEKNTGRELKEVRKTMCEQNENFNKKTQIIFLKIQKLQS